MDMDTKRLGKIVPDWTPRPRPETAPMQGRLVRLEAAHADTHAADLFAAFAGHDALWDYMPYGPFASAATYHRWVKDSASGFEPQYYAIRNMQSNHLVGIASYLNINPAHGSIEVGNICFSPALQQAAAATETMFLMMQWAFDAGYRRYEWKCNALNIPSRRAAQRLGFSYEGIFRQHMVIKGRSRDTAWFAIADSEWPALREAFGAWLSPANFDANGRQRERLSDLTQLVRHARDPAL